MLLPPTAALHLRRPALAPLSSAPLMIDPSMADPSVASTLTLADPSIASTLTLAFADQQGNLAGALFPASLPPYLLFLYFIRQDVNGLSPTAKAGFTSLLFFVVATVVTSIISVKSFGLPLANCDWLHSGAEQLLSFTNIVDVIGLKLTLDAYKAGTVGSSAIGGEAAAAAAPSSLPVLAGIGGVAVATCLATWVAAGGDLGAHTAYLGGLGNLPEGMWTLGFFEEPPNALSLPTWVIHLSSLLEWLVAMGLVWRIGTVSGNPKWKGLTWAMIPSHSSGVCACVYHFFYNAESLQFIVLLQAALTLLGNTTLAFAAWRLATSNGWTFSLPTLGADGDGDEQPPQPQPQGLENVDASPDSTAVDSSGGDVTGLVLIFAASIVGSYVVKYGETLLPFVADGESPAVPIVATLMVVAASGFNCWKWSQRSQEEADFGGLI